MFKIKNPIARAPILRKGGAHVKSKSSQRAKAKKDTQKALDDWKTSLF